MKRGELSAVDPVDLRWRNDGEKSRVDRGGEGARIRLGMRVRIRLGMRVRLWLGMRVRRRLDARVILGA